MKAATLSFGLVLLFLVAPTRQCYAPVGYVNLNLTSGFNFVANTLYSAYRTNYSDNGIAAVLHDVNPALDYARVWLWDIPSQSFTPSSTYLPGSGWSTNIQLPPGRGFVIYLNTPHMITFVGDIPEGLFTNFVAGSNKFSLVASPVPLSKSLSAFGFPKGDGEVVYTWDASAQRYRDASTCIGGYGWISADGTNGPTIPVANAFFVQNPGPDTNWIMNFQVNAPQFRDTSRPEAKSFAAHLKLDAQTVFLEVQALEGAPYDVQYSVSGEEWQTIATNQTGPVWQGSYPGGSQGYYQVVRRQPE